MAWIQFGTSESGGGSILKTRVPATSAMLLTAYPDAASETRFVQWVTGNKIIGTTDGAGGYVDLRPAVGARVLTARCTGANGVVTSFSKSTSLVEATDADEAQFAPAIPALKVHEGDLIGSPGTVYDRLDVRGMVRLNGATLRRSIVRGRNVPGFNGSLVAQYPNDPPGSLVEDVTIAPDFPTVGTNGMAVGTGMTVRRVTISGTTDGMVIAGNDVLIEDTKVSGLLWSAKDPAHSDGSHSDAAQIEGGRNIVLRRCELDSVRETRSRACQGVMVTQNWARIDGLKLEGCTLGGGHVSLNVSPNEKGRGPMLKVSVTDTVFRGDQTNGPVHAIFPKSLYPSVTFDRNTVTGSSSAPRIYLQP